MQVDPILDLEHVIGYNGSTCKDLVWSKQMDERAVLFASGGTLVSMDVNENKQRFFFGHNESICCFALNQIGTLVATG